MRKFFTKILIINLLIFSATKLHAATGSSDFGQFGSAIGALILHYSTIERINDICGLALDTGKEEIDSVLRKKIGVSLSQVKKGLGAPSSSSTELHVNKVVSGVENYIGCDKDELNALQRYFNKTIFQPYLEQIKQVQDTEQIRAFIQNRLMN